MLLLKSILLVCSATAVMARGSPDAIVSGALFVGEDTTNTGASGHDIFEDPRNHASATASILKYSAEAANYRPSEQDATYIVEYSRFQLKMETFPGFALRSPSQEVDVPLSNSLTQLETAIREKYPSANSKLIARSLRDLFPGSVEDKSLEEWILSLIVIDKPFDSNTVTVNHVELELRIAVDETMKTHIPEQTAKLYNTEFQVVASFLSNNADGLAQRISCGSVQDFIQYFASPKVFEELEDVLKRGSYSCRQEISSFASRPRQIHLARWMDV
ncbi:hypothetical protein BGX27_004969 [Mortierella sp. AM989]|nr:hypothetical protein BGX27_004969 [Mortierella sp. AM989]